jgi:hypothetical protein
MLTSPRLQKNLFAIMTIDLATIICHLWLLALLLDAEEIRARAKVIPYLRTTLIVQSFAEKMNFLKVLLHSCPPDPDPPIRNVSIVFFHKTHDHLTFIS